MDKQTESIILIKKALKGNQQAFHKLYNVYKNSLFLVCLRYGKDRNIAQDYLQDAFVNTFKNLKQFDLNKGDFGPWARKITVNACLADIRKNTLYSVNITKAEQVESSDVSALSQLSLKEMLDHIQKLPYGYRTVFNMYVIDGYSHKEIAAALNISISTSKSQLMKARKVLQKKVTFKQNNYTQEHG